MKKSSQPEVKNVPKVVQELEILNFRTGSLENFIIINSITNFNRQDNESVTIFGDQNTHSLRAFGSNMMSQRLLCSVESFKVFV